MEIILDIALGVLGGILWTASYPYLLKFRKAKVEYTKEDRNVGLLRYQEYKKK
jgi:hypothetical protein